MQAAESFWQLEHLRRAEAGAGDRRGGGNTDAEAREHAWGGWIYSGCIRAQHEFADLDFGVKASGTTPQRPRHDGIAQAGVALYFGGVVFNEGDYVYADADGVIVAKGPLDG